MVMGLGVGIGNIKFLLLGGYFEYMAIKCMSFLILICLICHNICNSLNIGLWINMNATQNNKGKEIAQKIKSISPAVYLLVAINVIMLIGFVFQ